MESFENIAESIFNAATQQYEKLFEAIDYEPGIDYFGMMVTETKSNANACENIINYVKASVSESYADIFDVSVERKECSDKEFPDDIANIEIYLSWKKVYTVE